MDRHDPYASLRVPDFRWLVLCNWAVTFATQIQAVVVGWQLYELTKNPLSLGLIGLAEALPFLGTSLYAGHVVDRASRRRAALASLAVLFFCAAALLVLTMTPGAVSSTRTWPFYAVIFVSGIARSFLRPAVTALSANVVPRELYPNAVAWRSSLWQFAAVAGPAAGGVLYGFVSVVAAYAADILLMVVALAAMGRLVEASRPSSGDDMPIRESLLVGIRFVKSQPVLLGALTLDLFAVLFGGAVALLPVFAAEILHVGPQGLGLLRAAPAAGSVGMSLFLAHRPPLRSAGPTLLGSVALFGVCMIGFALSRSFWLSLALLTLSGMADNVSVVIRSTLLQLMVPQHLLGRVSSVNQIFIGSSNEIGAFESGVAARYLGTVPSVVIGGAITVFVVAACVFVFPQLRRLERLESATR